MFVWFLTDAFVTGCLCVWRGELVVTSSHHLNINDKVGPYKVPPSTSPNIRLAPQYSVTRFKTHQANFMTSC